jgi:serine/threonine protein kinase
MTKVKIIDLGFTFLKKYCALLAGYSNKGPYTAPEHLVQKGQVVENATEASDIYSLGIMLSEIVSGKSPFRHMSLTDVKIEVVEDKARPDLPSSTPESLKRLIKACWNHVAADRPSFIEIEDVLTSILIEIKSQTSA